MTTHYIDIDTVIFELSLTSSLPLFPTVSTHPNQQDCVAAYANEDRRKVANYATWAARIEMKEERIPKHMR